jgi:hypothetical protein
MFFTCWDWLSAIESGGDGLRTNPKSKIGVSCLAHGRGLMKKFQSCLTQSSEFKCNALDCKRSFSSGGWTGFCLICSLQ